MPQCFNFSNIYINLHLLSFMLDNSIIKKINDFVYQKPRTVQEVSELIKKSWKTAESYVNKISDEQGTISTRTFRGGTRGALKIVFWNTLDSLDKNNFQLRLYKQIESGRFKQDFSPLDIYQHIDKDKKSSRIFQDGQYDSKENFCDFKDHFLSASKDIFLFSGNLTFTKMGYKDEGMLDIIKELVKKGINFKILTRIEFSIIEDVLDLLAINKESGRTAIEIRHCYQPLRCTVVDDKVATLKEVEIPTSPYDRKFQKQTNMIFKIYDEDWVGWLKKVFWDLFRTAIPCEKRLEELNYLRKKHL